MSDVLLNLGVGVVGEHVEPVIRDLVNTAEPVGLERGNRFGGAQGRRNPDGQVSLTAHAVPGIVHDG